VLAAGLATTFIPATKPYAARIGAFEFLLHLVFFAVVNGAYDTPYVFAANGVVTLGFLYLVWPIPFMTACIYGIAGTILYCGIVVAARPWSAELALLLLIFISMNCVCIFAMYQAKYYRRAAFLNTQDLDAERLRYRELLTSILPREVADRLQRGETVADLYEDVSVLFVDICNFTPLSARFPPIQVLSWLGRVFAAFDALVETHRLEKIKTIGDAYMVAGGFASGAEDHLDAMMMLALDMIDAASAIPGPDGLAPQVRIGIHTGPVVAGVIGSRRFLYDLWGDTVNTASRMESHGLANTIQVTETVRARLADRYSFERRHVIEVKGKGQMATWLLGTEARIRIAG
jgi:class 3 adenylate cyclase